MKYTTATFLFALAALQSAVVVSPAPQAKPTASSPMTSVFPKDIMLPATYTDVTSSPTSVATETTTSVSTGQGETSTSSTSTTVEAIAIPAVQGSTTSSAPAVGISSPPSSTVHETSSTSSPSGGVGAIAAPTTVSVASTESASTTSAPSFETSSGTSTSILQQTTIIAQPAVPVDATVPVTSSSSSTSTVQQTTAIEQPAVPIDATVSSTSTLQPTTIIAQPAIPIDFSSSLSTLQGTTSSTISGGPVPTLISTTKAETEAKTFNFQKSLSTSLNDQGTKLTVQVTSSNEGQGFRGDFNVQTEGAFHASANFYRRQNDTDSFFKLRAGLLKFVELNAAVDWNLTSSGNVINFANLSSNFWSPITIADVPNNHNVTIKSITTTFSMQHPNQNNLFPKKGNRDWAIATLKEAADGEEINANITVKFEAFMVNDTVTLDNVIHTPKSLKYSLKISNFPFVYSDSQLAIVKGVYFKKGEETNYSSAASSLSIAGGKSHFNWTNAVTLDSLTSTLSTDSSITVEDVPDSNPQESVAQVVFRTNGTFVDSLVWDPEVILDENKLVESYNQTGAGTKSGVEKLFSSSSSFVVIAMASIVMVLLNGF